MIAWDDINFLMGSRDSIKKITEYAEFILKEYERRRELNDQMWLGMMKLVDANLNELLFLFQVARLCERIEKLGRVEASK